MTSSCGCLAVDVVRAGLDPLTGRTLSFNHVPMAAWAGHLCDLIMLGALADVNGVAVPASEPDVDAIHPLVASAWGHVRAHVPREWRYMFGPQVVDINDVAAEARGWLVESGVWSRRRSLFGWRYRSTGSPPPRPTLPPPGTAEQRAQLVRALVSIAGVGDLTVRADRGVANVPRPQREDAFHTVLRTTSELIAWKAANPPLPRTGGM